MKFSRSYITLLASLPISAHSFAPVDINKIEKFESVTDYGGINDFFKKIRPYEGNSVFIDYGRGNSLDRHLDIQYSFRYLFTEPESLKNEGDFLHEWAFTYTGEFDFYAGTRDSGPVIGRRYNPGVRYQWRVAQDSGFVALNASIEHESNGQVINSENAVKASTISLQGQYEANNPDVPSNYYLEMATDSVSRSTEYFLSVGGVYRLNFSSANWNTCDKEWSCFDIISKFRKGDGFEDDVFWDEAMTDAKLKEHQGTELVLFSRWLPKNAFSFLDGPRTISVSYRTGEVFGGKPGNKGTWDISYSFNLSPWEGWDLPLMIQYHHGYLEELSRYSYSTSFWRVGFNLDL